MTVFREREKRVVGRGYRYYDIIRNGLDYVHSFLEGGYQTVTQQDCIDGAFFLMNKSIDFKENPLMRQNLLLVKKTIVMKDMKKILIGLSMCIVCFRMHNQARRH